MARNTASTVYIGNLDDKVCERVLYEILIHAGHLVNVHIPRDKETNQQKHYAFAEYETEETAQYAVKLFNGTVRLNGRYLKFEMSGQDKPNQNQAIPAGSRPHSPLSSSLPVNSQAPAVPTNSKPMH